MKRIYKQNLSIRVDEDTTRGTIENRVIPLFDARYWQSDDAFVIFDKIRCVSYRIRTDEICNRDGVLVGDTEAVHEYLSSFIGGFSIGGGTGNGGTGYLSGVVDLFSNLPDPTTVPGERYEVTTGEGGTIVLGQRFGGNDPGIYKSDGTAWVFLPGIELDTTDILSDPTGLAFTIESELNLQLLDLSTFLTSFSNSLNNLQTQISSNDVDITALNNSITQININLSTLGDLITNNTININSNDVDIQNINTQIDAINTQISTLSNNLQAAITNLTGLNNGTVNVHSDSNINFVAAQDGDSVVVIGGEMVIKPRDIIIEKSGYERTENDFDTPILDITDPDTNVALQIDVTFPEIGTWKPHIDFGWSCNTTGANFEASCTLDGNSIVTSNPVSAKVTAVEPKDSAGQNPDFPTTETGAGTDQFVRGGLVCNTLTIADTNPKTLQLLYGCDGEDIIASIAEITIRFERVYGVITVT